MARFDFKTSPTGSNDIVLDSNGEFQFTSTLQEALSQQIEVTLNTWTGEWIYNTEFGTPYKQRIFTSGKSKEEIDAEFVRVIQSVSPDITSISQVTSSLDRVNRVYDLRRVDVYCDDGLLELPVSSPVRRLNEYPEPRTFEDFRVCVLDDAELDDINALYSHINFDLWSGGDSTWWNIWGGGADPQ